MDLGPVDYPTSALSKRAAKVSVAFTAASTTRSVPCLSYAALTAVLELCRTQVPERLSPHSPGGRPSVFVFLISREVGSLPPGLRASQCCQR